MLPGFTPAVCHAASARGQCRAARRSTARRGAHRKCLESATRGFDHILCELRQATRSRARSVLASPLQFKTAAFQHFQHRGVLRQHFGDKSYVASRSLNNFDLPALTESKVQLNEAATGETK
jgi:hypothetical protein